MTVTFPFCYQCLKIFFLLFYFIIIFIFFFSVYFFWFLSPNPFFYCSFLLGFSREFCVLFISSVFASGVFPICSLSDIFFFLYHNGWFLFFSPSKCWVKALRASIQACVRTAGDSPYWGLMSMIVSAECLFHSNLSSLSLVQESIVRDDTGREEQEHLSPTFPNFLR